MIISRGSYKAPETNICLALLFLKYIIVLYLILIWHAFFNPNLLVREGPQWSHYPLITAVIFVYLAPKTDLVIGVVRSKTHIKIKCNQIAWSIDINPYDVLNFFIKDLRLQPSPKFINIFRTNDIWQKKVWLLGNLVSYHKFVNQWVFFHLA